MGDIKVSMCDAATSVSDGESIMNLPSAATREIERLQQALAAEREANSDLRAEMTEIDLALGDTGMDRSDAIGVLQAELATERERADEQTERARKYKRAWTQVESDLVDAEAERYAAIERADSEEKQRKWAEKELDGVLERCDAALERANALQAALDNRDKALAAMVERAERAEASLSGAEVIHSLQEEIEEVAVRARESRARAEAAEAEVERLRAEVERLRAEASVLSAAADSNLDALRETEATVDTLRDRITKALVILDAPMDGCSDNGCCLQWPRHKQGTNGGCHCLDGLKPELRVKVRKRLKAGREAIDALKGEER